MLYRTVDLRRRTGIISIHEEGIFNLKINFNSKDRNKNKRDNESKPLEFFHIVSHTGFEPVTSALSRQRSKPAELMTLKVAAN